MKLEVTSVLLLIASFGVALNLLPLSRREMHGNGQGIPNMRLTARQGTEVTKSTSQSLREPVSTGNVQCDQNWLSSRSAELISPVGIRASVELRGKTLVGKTSDDNRCETTWILHLADQGLPQTLVVDTRDEEWYYEQIFEMNGWSKDGTRLLMSQIVAAGDWDETTPIVYDVRDHETKLIILSPLFEEFTPENCPIYFRPLGFSSSRKILLDVGSLNASDLGPGERPCFQNSRWELDYTQKRVIKVSSATSFEKFGTVAGKSPAPAQN